MYNEKEPQVLPFAADSRESKIQCWTYLGVFAALGGFLIGLMRSRGYGFDKMGLIFGAYAVIALATWLPMLLRCVTKLHLENDGVRITAFGLTLRRFPLGKIRFVTAMECSGKNRTAGRSQILLCAHTFDELAKKGGWRSGGSGGKTREECARESLRRFVSAYYVRELNLTKDILWLDWSPERIRLIRWMYPDAGWADFSHNRIYEKQMNG